MTAPHRLQQLVRLGDELGLLLWCVRPGVCTRRAGGCFGDGLFSVAAVVGHDFGSMIAAHFALVRPDVFRSLVMMSFAFDGPLAIPFESADSPVQPKLVSLDE
jgi:pimeloyl-ACP methyl ester carboxylesterase